VRRKKLILWTAGGIITLILMVAVTGLVLVNHSQRFRGYLLHRVQQSVEQRTGARITVRDFTVAFSGLRLDLYGMVIHGRESPAQRPLLSADHIRVSLAVGSLISGKWRLRNLTADHPVASIFVNRDGVSNLPAPRVPSGSQTDLFELAVERAAIHQGEVYYNDHKVGLDGSLNDLDFAAAFDREQTRYYGNFCYSNGNIRYGQYAPTAHTLDARFQVTPTTFTLDHVQVATGGSRLVLDASVEDYANTPQLQANYDALLATRDLAHVLKDSTIPTGDLRFTGVLRYQVRPNRPLLESVKLAGTVTSAELQFVTPTIRAPLRELKARYTLEYGDATVDGLYAQVLGGTLNGGLTVRDVSGAQKGKLHASLRGVSLDQVVTRSRPLQQSRLSGRLDADAEATWAKSLKNLIARVDANLQGTLCSNPSMPVDGAVHANYTQATQQAALHQSYFRTSQTSITLDGTVSTNSSLQVRVTSGDLHEIELLAENFRGGTQGAPAGKALNLGLYGNARFNASVGGSLENPQIRGTLEATNLRIKGSTWRTLRTGLSATSSSLALENGELQASSHGHFAFNVRAGLTHWSYGPANPINVNLSASQLSLADLQEFAGKNYPIAGTLAMNVSLHGTQLNPAGQGNISITNGLISNEPFQSLGLNFHGDGATVHANLVAHAPAGSARADATIDPKTGAYNFQFHAASIRLEHLQAVKTRNMEVAGAINLDASGRGNMENPELDATFTIPELRVQQQTIRNATLQTTLRNHIATVNLNSEAARTAIKAHGTIGTQEPYVVDVHVDTGRIGLQPLVALYSPAQSANLDGQMELHLALRGPLQDRARMEAHLEIPALTATYQQLHIGSAKPIHVDYQNGIAVLQPVTLEGTDTSINLQATIPVNDPNAAALMLKGSIDLRVAQLLSADLKSSGQIRFDIDSHGIAPGTGMHGQVRIVDASVHTADMPIGLDHANGVINVTPTRLDVGTFQAEMGGGRINARGGIAFRPDVQFDLALEGDSVRLRYPQGIRALLSSSLALTGRPHAAVLGGRIQIEQLSFTPDFDLSNLSRQLDGETSAPATAGGFAQSLRLNIAVQSATQMNLESSQVSVHGSANLRVVGTASQPVVLGRSDLTGGELFFGGHRYVVESGIVNFLNPLRTEPVLNLRVQTKINDYNITLGLQGPVSRLRTTYVSDPALPPADIINLIARGETMEAAAAQPSQPLSLGAQSLVASTVSGQIGNRIAKVAGISQLQIDPSLGASNGQNPGARIAIQQRVTSSLFVTVATDVTSTQRQSIELEYQLNPRWSVSGVRDQNGGVTALAHYKRKF
jgi:translocation and assembly module TamB